MTEKARSALLKVCVRNKQDEASGHLPKRVYIEHTNEESAFLLRELKTQRSECHKFA